MKRSAIVFVSLLAMSAPVGVLAALDPGQGRGQGRGQGQPQRPARDTPAPKAVGSATIKGRVVTADTGAPVRRATVRFSAPELREGRGITTDAQGRFEVRDLPPGKYSITATKPGFLTATYGAPRPGEPGKPVEVASAQVVERIDLPLSRGGVIAGRVVDDAGEPVIDVQVVAVRKQTTSGRVRFMPSGRTIQTNDIGQYRVYALSPGEYYVMATLRGDMNAESGDRIGFAPTYYPNTPAAGEAQKIVVVAGQEHNGIDIALAPVKVAKVQGTVLDSSGQFVTNGTVMARLAGGRMMPMGPEVSGAIQRDGSFTMRNVVPGDYTLTVTTRGGAEGPPIGRGDMPPGGGRGGPPGNQEYAAVPLKVAGEDITGVTIMTTKGATATGRVVVDGNAPASFQPQSLRLSTSPADPDDFMSARPATGGVNADWTFQLQGLHGAVRFTLGGLPQGWTLKAVQFGNSDIIDTGIEFKGSGEARDISLVITNRVTELTGSVTNSQGEPVKVYTVLLFPDDPAKWGAMTSRYQRTARPDPDGRYKLTALPPGDYVAVALESIANMDPFDPAMLEKLRQVGTRVTLLEGETKALDVRIATP